MDLLIIKVKSKFMQADRHLDRTEKVLHCLDSCQGGLFEIKAARDIEYVGRKLCETLRIYIVYISCPASPDRCKTGTVSDIIESAKLVLKLVTCPVATAGSTSGQTLVREASCPHDLCAGGVVVRFPHKNTCVVDDSLHQRFTDAVCDLHSLDIDEITLHGVHEDIHTAALRLILRKAVGKLRVHQGKFRTAEIAFGSTSFQPAILIGDDRGIAHLTSGSCNGRDDADRKTGSRNFCLEIKIPDICPWICNAVPDRLGRVNNTSTADSENEIYVFFLTELDTFTYFGKTRVRDNAAQGNEINAGISKTSGNFVDQPGSDGTLASVMDQNFVTVLFLQNITNLQMRIFTKNNLCRGKIFKTAHNSYSLYTFKINDKFRNNINIT